MAKGDETGQMLDKDVGGALSFSGVWVAHQTALPWPGSQRGHVAVLATVRASLSDIFTFPSAWCLRFDFWFNVKRKT